MEPGGGPLTKLLQIFVFNFVGAAGRLTPDAQWLLLMLFAIELVIAGIWFALRHELDMWLLVSRSLTAVVLGWLITQWPTVPTVVMKSFLAAGLKAGGDVLTETDFTNPDRIVTYGLAVTKVQFQAIADTSLFSVKAVGINFVAGIIALVTLGAYLVLAIVVFLSLLEFYGNLAITAFLLPFGIFGRTHWLGERAIACIFAACIRIFLIAFLLSSTNPLLTTASLAASDALVAAVYTLVTALALCSLAWQLNRWAQSVYQGSTTLSLQDVTRVGHTLSRHVQQLSSVLTTLTDLLQQQGGAASRPTTSTPRRPL